MPAAFEKCVNEGGRVRTVSGPDEEHGLKEDEYVQYCYKDDKSYRGEVKKKKSKKSSVSKLITHIKLKEDIGDQSIIEVMRAGRWEHPSYGVVEITERDIDKFIESFEENVRKVDIAVDQEHKPREGAAGWFKNLKKFYEDGKAVLKATVEWTSMGKELIKNKIFKYFSPEFDFEYEDQETHEIYENVLLGGALTNRPYFKDLAPVTLSENMFAKFNESKGGEEEMLTKKELKANLADDSDYTLPEDASDEEKKLFKEVKEELANEVEEQDSGDDKEPNIKGSENYISRAEHTKKMNELKTQMGVVEKKLRMKEVQSEVNGLVFSESNPDGKLLKKSKDKAVEVLMASNEKVAKLFREFIETLPSLSNKMFEEEGTGKDSDTGMSVIEKEANKLVEDGEAAKYSEAVKQLRRNKPELFK